MVLRRTLALALICLLFIAAPVVAGEESCRIRIENEPKGLVQVSLDGGKTYGTVGRVTVAANARIIGFAAASYTPAGAVAATAVHGLRIKTGQLANRVGKAQMPLLFSICPLEFATTPRGYGGHLPRSSGIHTDIYAGRSIFRNTSPYVGSPVYIEREHNLVPLPEDYTPIIGEKLVIVVKRPDDDIREVEFENRAQGKVTVRYADGTSRVIAEVVRPVLGTGRYDGTTFTGVGAVNTNHGGVITISTAPTCLPKTCEGGAQETRGGFMIQPYYHAREQGETSPQVMVVAHEDRSKPVLEGSSPLFSGCINLSRFSGVPERSFRAQVRIDGGEWEDMPKIVGKANGAFTPAYLESYFAGIGRPRSVIKGVTAIRLLFPSFDSAVLARNLAREVSDYTSRAVDSGVAARKGTVPVRPKKLYGRKCVVSFYVDGVFAYLSGEYPYKFDWDTTKFANGFHAVTIETVTSAGADPIVETRRILVRN